MFVYIPVNKINRLLAARVSALSDVSLSTDDLAILGRGNECLSSLVELQMYVSMKHIICYNSDAVRFGNQQTCLQ